MNPAKPSRIRRIPLAATLPVALCLCLVPAIHAQGTPSAETARTASSATAAGSVEERNKALARAFYEDLWFSQRTDRYERYLADEYVVHDIGDDKNLVEPAVQQKKLADCFHSQGNMGGSIDFQIAEGDLVATRWQWEFEPTSLLFRIMGGRDRIPIINVFRFQNGKIVEIWNHRHDIDTGRGNIPLYQGLAIGLVVALIGWAIAFVQWRRRRRARAHAGAGGA